MLQYIERFITIVLIAFFVWLAVSWIQVVILNVEGIEISSWNIFKIALKFS